MYTNNQRQGEGMESVLVVGSGKTNTKTRAQSRVVETGIADESDN